MKRGAEHRLLELGGGEEPLESGEEIKGVEAGLEVIFYEGEELGVLPDILLAFKDELQDLLIRFEEAAGDFFEQI